MLFKFPDDEIKELLKFFLQSVAKSAKNTGTAVTFFRANAQFSVKKNKKKRIIAMKLTTLVADD